MGIKDYSTTAANNTTVGSISVAEGMLPSNINNAFRGLAAEIREFYNDSQWVIYGDGDGSFTAAYASATSFTIAGSNVTAFYHAGRRIKAVGSSTGTIVGTIASSSFSTNTTVNVTWDSGSLSSESLTIYVGALSKTNSSIPEGIVATATLADGSVTTAKLAADAVTNAKIADDSIDSEHYVDGSIDTAHIADAQITTAKITDANVTTAKIAADAITGAKISDDAIDSEHYTDGSIDTAHIADSQVTTAKIADSAITSAKINDGAIVNADINASAAIAATKIHDGTISNTEFGYLNGVSSNIQTQLDAKQASDAQLTDIAGLTPTDSNFIVGDGSNFVTESGSTARTSLGLGSISTQAANSVSISGGSITGLGAPSSGSDAATKTYVDDLVAGLKTRIICRAATTGNVTLSSDLQNGDSLDGITLATGDRVLVKDQSTGSQNGIYTVVASGTASRDTDFDVIGELAGQLVIIQEGSVNAEKMFLCTTDSDASLGSDTITFTVVQPANVGDVTLTGTQTLTNKTLTSPAIDTSITHADNVKAYYGTGNDLEVYHNGSNSIIEDTGTGDLLLRSNSYVRLQSNTGENMLYAQPDGEVTLYHNNVNKFSTTAAGVQTVGTLNINAAYAFPTSDGSATQILQTDGSGSLTFVDKPEDPVALAIALG